jgi:CheY-like chemotaxis protein
VVALTAHTKALDEERALSAGCIAYLTKPIRLTHFPGQIDALLAPKEIPA